MLLSSINRIKHIFIQQHCILKNIFYLFADDKRLKLTVQLCVEYCKHKRQQLFLLFESCSAGILIPMLLNDLSFKGMKTVHVVFGNSALSRLRAFFKKERQNSTDVIFCFRDDLSIGPIAALETEQGNSNRVSYLKNIHLERNADSCMKFCQSHIGISSINSFKFGKYDKVVIWHGSNIQEKLLLYLVSTLLPEGNLYEAAITDAVKQHGYVPIKLAECSTSSIATLIQNIAPIDSQKKEGYKQEWVKTSQSDKLVRILKEGSIVEVDENYYDSYILSDCTEDYTPASQIVWNVMGRCGQSIADAFLKYRVKGLVTRKELNNKGGLLSLSNFGQVSLGQ
jgi:hypothetical protein